MRTFLFQRVTHLRARSGFTISLNFKEKNTIMTEKGFLDGNEMTEIKMTLKFYQSIFQLNIL